MQLVRRQSGIGETAPAGSVLIILNQTTLEDAMNKTISLLFTLGLLLGAPWLSTSGTANADEEKRTTTTIREKQLGDDLDADGDKT
ncbi:MAG TPA: hypothetical protein VMR29_06920, partial [Candidatus Binatia bacterium]|nr:hypothetical protein [Candidatus Binatia bacterium]